MALDIESLIEPLKSAMAAAGANPAVPARVSGRLASVGLIAPINALPCFDGKKIHFQTELGYTREYLPRDFAFPLLTRALAIADADAAAAEFREVLEWREALGKTTLAFWGLKIESPIVLRDDLQLVPFSTLPDCQQKLAVTAQQRMAGPISPALYEWHDPDSALVCTHRIDQVAKLFPIDEALPRSTELGPISRYIQDALALLASIGPRSVASAGQWFCYDDEVLNHFVDHGRVLHTPEFAVLKLREFGAFDAGLARSILGSFFELPPNNRSSLMYSLHRLWAAMSRRDASDAAVELSTGLESLLVGEGTELKYRLALRAAVLLGTDDASRQRIRECVSRVYWLRNKRVHDGREAKADDGEKVDACMPVLASVIHALIYRPSFVHAKDNKWAPIELQVAGGA